jgi:FkbM family methyltransferase
MSLLKIIVGKFRAAKMLFRIMRDFKNWKEVWAAYLGKGAKPAELQFRSGLRVISTPNDDILPLYIEIFVREDYTHSGFYSPKDGDVVLDVGANIGTFTLSQLAKCSTLKVHAFEPSEKTRARLQMNLDANHFQQSVTIHPFGLSDASKVLILDDHHFAGSRSAHASTDPQSGEEIHCISLKEAVDRTGEERIALLKIDIEGAEIDVFQEQDEATWNKIERIALEFHGSIRPGALEQLKDIFAKRKFQVAHIFAPPPGGIDGILQVKRI